MRKVVDEFAKCAAARPRSKTVRLWNSLKGIVNVRLPAMDRNNDLVIRISLIVKEYLSEGSMTIV
jgi:hypothetical protein